MTIIYIIVTLCRITVEHRRRRLWYIQVTTTMTTTDKRFKCRGLPFQANGLSIAFDVSLFMKDKCRFHWNLQISFEKEMYPLGSSLISGRFCLFSVDLCHIHRISSYFIEVGFSGFIFGNPQISLKSSADSPWMANEPKKQEILLKVSLLFLFCNMLPFYVSFLVRRRDKR